MLLGLHFEHRSLSVFRTFDEFSRINPVVKAPTFVCDDGTVLMDSTLILQYAQSLSPGRPLLPPSDPALKRALRLVGLALAATDKSVQAVYEQQLRPDDKQHAPWLDRVWTRARRRTVFPFGYPSSRGGVFADRGLRGLIAMAGLPARTPILTVTPLSLRLSACA